jgi:hypothetical protein
VHGRRLWLVRILAGIALSLGPVACGGSTTLLHGAGGGAGQAGGGGGGGGSGAGAGAGTTSRGRIAGPGVPGDVVRVIRGWADALRAGHVAAAAGYFRLPSVFFDGSSPPVRLRTLAQVEQVNAALPCGATLITVTRRGSFYDALFRLGNRAGPGGAGGCGSGSGQTARTDFQIRAGRIAEWLRAPDEPGDNGTAPGQGLPAPGSPSSSPPGPIV